MHVKHVNRDLHELKEIYSGNVSKETYNTAKEAHTPNRFHGHLKHEGMCNMSKETYTNEKKSTQKMCQKRPTIPQTPNRFHGHLKHEGMCNMSKETYTNEKRSTGKVCRMLQKKPTMIKRLL